MALQVINLQLLAYGGNASLMALRVRPMVSKCFKWIQVPKNAISQYYQQQGMIEILSHLQMAGNPRHGGSAVQF